MTEGVDVQRPRRILGIDPGLRVTGFGVLELHGAALGAILHSLHSCRDGTTNNGNCARRDGTAVGSHMAGFFEPILVHPLNVQRRRSRLSDDHTGGSLGRSQGCVR